MKKINKIVIPVAGLGTRMLPATKAIPKEMLPVVNKPIIQYIVEEVIYGGFMRKTSNIEILKTLQNTDTSKMNENEKKNITDCINLLNKETSVITYNNKVALFTRLNNVVECGICYDEKLNINLHCGHCVCVDCYQRLVNTSCPFCRMDTPYGFFD